MIVRLVMRGLRRGKTRFACAMAGIAVAVGAVTFVSSLAATHAAQAPRRARHAAAPWAAWRQDGSLDFGYARRGFRATEGTCPAKPAPDCVLDVVALTLDYRVGGHVLQGPPMTVIMTAGVEVSPFSVAPLASGRWPDARSRVPEIVCTPDTFRRFGRGQTPPLGTQVKFVGLQNTLVATVVGYLADATLLRSWPGVFANPVAFAAWKGEQHATLSLWRQAPDASGGFDTPESPQVMRSFVSDDERRMDYARPLLLLAAVLTALALLVNSLLLSVEANRTTLATLRTVGFTRLNVVGFVAVEALLAAVAGLGLGVLGALGALAAWVAADPATFPVGMAVAWGKMSLAGGALPVLVLVAVLFALRPALAVRPMDAAAQRPLPRRRGMAITFACGFAAFVAVEVWGGSLMRAFVPSPEWPDATVSLLPNGVSSFDVEKLRKLPGVKRVSELLPLQLDLVLPPGEELDRTLRSPPTGRRFVRNALFLAAEWLPSFRFVEGSREVAVKEMAARDAVVITDMMSRALKLHLGDKLRVWVGRGPNRQEVALPIVGVVDLNWHMVTSRGLLRGLNGSSRMTDGPVFAAFDTVEVLDARPSPMVRMTHLWVEYDPAFLAARGVFPAGREVEREIAAALGNPSDVTVRLHARDEVADGTLAHGDDLIGHAARVPFVFLFVLAIGFVAMLVAEADARRREFGILRAVGATRGQLLVRLAGSAVKTALAGILLGVPSGAFVGWVFAGHTGNWPGLPHYFVLPVQVTLEGAVGALVFALIFAIPTSALLVFRKRDMAN